MLENNKFVKVFYSAGERLRVEPSLELSIVIRSDTVSDKKRYNKPNENEVAKLLAGQADAELKRDVIVFQKNGSLKCVNVLHGAYDPLQYVLLFHMVNLDGINASILSTRIIILLLVLMRLR